MHGQNTMHSMPSLFTAHFFYPHLNFSISSFFRLIADMLLCKSASAGLGFLQFCNLNSMRTKFILGFSLFMGLSVPQYFKEYELIAGYGPVHTRTQSVCSFLLCRYFFSLFISVHRVCMQIVPCCSHIMCSSSST